MFFSDSPLKKLNFMLKKLQKSFKSSWLPYQFSTVDEYIIPTKCFLSGFQIYMPDKPVSVYNFNELNNCTNIIGKSKWGIKVWMSVDSAGYLYAFDIYTGRKNRKTKNKNDKTAGSRDIRPRRNKIICFNQKYKEVSGEDPNQDDVEEPNLESEQEITTEDPIQDDVGLGHKIVLEFSRQYPEGENFVFVGDNYFSSVELVKNLEEKGQYYIGTIRKNRK